MSNDGLCPYYKYKGKAPFVNPILLQREQTSDFLDERHFALWIRLLRTEFAPFRCCFASHRFGQINALLFVG